MTQWNSYLAKASLSTCWEWGPSNDKGILISHVARNMIIVFASLVISLFLDGWEWGQKLLNIHLKWFSFTSLPLKWTTVGRVLNVMRMNKLLSNNIYKQLQCGADGLSAIWKIKQVPWGLWVKGRFGSGKQLMWQSICGYKQAEIFGGSEFAFFSWN